MPLIKKPTNTQAPHLIIDARAGTGKTTTLINAMAVLQGKKPAITPSEQQAVIFKEIKKSKGTAKSVAFVAFNKSIATELGKRIPKGCGDAMTMHSMGNRAITQAYGRLVLDGNKTMALISKVLGQDIRQLRRTDWEFLMLADKLVGLCKMNLSSGLPDEIAAIASHHGLDLNGSSQRIYDLVPQVIDLAADPLETGTIDFNDMVWLPIANDLPIPRYDLLMVDESQDLNRCQQALAKKAGRRLVFCGDPKQAIYGFTGADSESMDRLYGELQETEQGCLRLPLTVTRRCGKAIVAKANTIVKDFQAHEDNPEGIVRESDFEKYHKEINEGDMVLCRTNAPLVMQCFKFLRNGRKATIQGRDIGRGLISMINKSHADTIPELVTYLSDWVEREVAKEQAKPIPSDTKLQLIHDRSDCLLMFTEHKKTIQEVKQAIETMFADGRTGGILLSSVHKAKGLEADRVFILQPKGPASMPASFAKLAWEKEQERNIYYVAITRAINELVITYQDSDGDE